MLGAGHKRLYALALMAVLLSALVAAVALGCGSSSTGSSGTVLSSQPVPGTSSSTTATTSSPTVTSVTTTSLATTTTGVSTTTSTTESVTPVEYRNTQYGFTFSLPADWKGYSIVTEKWQGFPISTGNASSSTTSAAVYGPELLIRNPLWTAKNPRQDIPIMIFTTAQWGLVQQMKLSVGAAPVPPSELGHNSTYVFALPARYNYAFQTGYQEVEKILAGKPLQAF